MGNGELYVPYVGSLANLPKDITSPTLSLHVAWMQGRLLEAAERQKYHLRQVQINRHKHGVAAQLRAWPAAFTSVAEV
jgi:hypothetical protein